MDRTASECYDLFKSIESDFKNLSSKQFFGSEYPKTIDGIKMSVDTISDYEKNDLFFYVDCNLIDNIVKFQRRLKDIRDDENMYECCVCYDEIKKRDTVYMNCSHNVCIGCMKMIKDGKCPMCRGKIWDTYDNDKFCIVSLGEPTDKYNFDNGGYKSVKLTFLPPHNGRDIIVIKNLKYNENDPKKEMFNFIIDQCIDSGYSIIIQDKEKFKKWAEYVYLDRMLVFI